MNTLHTTARHGIAAACAAVVTLTLFSSVISLAEPQRGQLLARQQVVPAAGMVVAANDTATAGVPR